jgi:hypothetical protein
MLLTSCCECPADDCIEWLCRLADIDIPSPGQCVAIELEAKKA